MAAPPVRRVDTPQGEGVLHYARSRRPRATLLLGHGAGRGPDSPDLEALRRHLPRNGVSVILFEQPWHVARKRVAPAPSKLDEALVAAASSLRTRTRLIVGGRSAGARSAARCARTLGASGCLALAFPLHPPGKPEKSRLEELRGARLPTLVVQGERDTFGRPEEFPDDLDLTLVPSADHSFAVPRRAGIADEEVTGIIVEAVLEWAVREVVG